MDLATATNITSSNLLSATNNHHNLNHPRDLSENQFVEKHESVIETKIKPLTFTNGVFKRHGSNPGGNVVTTALAHSNAAAAEIATKQLVAVATSTIYKECLKNHAASLGGHALDGCGEFMPSPNSSPANPTSLKCAACGCHRNFHRRDPDDPCPLVIQPPTTTTRVIEYQPLHRHHPPAPVTSPSPASFRRQSPSSPSPPPISSSYYPSSAPQMLLALSSSGAQNPFPAKTPPLVQIPAENSQNVSVFATTPVSNNNTMQMMTTATTPNGRKRFRTKFTSGQKEKMLDFAERVGWKMQKRDDEIVASLCNEIGVDRGVLKVWMHNNKSKSGDNHQINNRPQQQTHVLSNVVASATNVTNIVTNIVRTNNVHAVENNALNMNHSVMHNNNLNNHNGGVIGGLQVNVRGDNGNNHDNDDEDDSDDDDEEDDDDTSPHHGANGSSSSS